MSFKVIINSQGKSTLEFNYRLKDTAPAFKKAKVMDPNLQMRPLFTWIKETVFTDDLVKDRSDIISKITIKEL